MSLSIRRATIEDAESINSIANWYIENTTINFDLTPWQLEKRRQWLTALVDETSPYTLLVGEQGDEIIGFSYNVPLRHKPSYQNSTETTVYCAHDKQSKGYGKILYEALMTHLYNKKFHRAYAFISLPNSLSIKLHQHFDYNLVGELNQAGYKFNQFHSVALYEKKLS